MKRLARALEVPLPMAVGLVELLFHLGQTQCHVGDVGALDDSELAEELGWGGDPGGLVEALVASGWLDRCPCHRLRIHDWPEHCDQTVMRVISARKLVFPACYDDASTMLAASKPPMPSPSPTPTPIPKPSPVAESPPQTAPTARSGEKRSPPSEPLRLARLLADRLREAEVAVVLRRGWEARWAREIAALAREASDLRALPDDAARWSRIEFGLLWATSPENLGRDYEVVVRSGASAREKWPKLVAAARRKRKLDPGARMEEIDRWIETVEAGSAT